MNKEQLAELQTVPDYRFGRLVKGESYAYARGLTINPSHLPGALDAMLKDGWRLLSVFGKTDSENVGFIFERGDVETKPFGFGGAVDILVTRLAKANAECFRLRHRVDELLRANSGLVENNRALRRQVAECSRLRHQVDELLRANSGLVENNRALRRQVADLNGLEIE